MRESLLTCEFLIARKLKITNKCYFCNQNGESINYIFKYYPFPKEFDIVLNAIVLLLLFIKAIS